MKTALVWFRRDFRLTDNPALQRALESAERIVPVYVHAPEEQGGWKPGAASDWWLHHSLVALSSALAQRGSRLVIRRGDSLAELRRLAAESGATEIFWNRLYEPALVERDTRIKDALRHDGLDAESENSALLVEPWTLKTAAGDPYRVFTPFWRAAAERLHPGSVIPAPGRMPGIKLTGLMVDELGLRPRISWDAAFTESWQPGETGAMARLERFCRVTASQYGERRDIPGVEGTSGLSPHLHFGEIGPRQVLARIERLKAESREDGVLRNAEHYVRELGWREFSHHLLFHFPATTDHPLNPRFRDFPWRKPADYAADLRAWQRGRTGVPIIDAGMRQLWTSGWMHNRVRMIVASFLTKNLLIPWQEGARWFWDTLVDASLPQNTLGWQWSAGSGADAAPFFRIFNPVLQSAKFDPQGVYLRRWVPEIAKLPDEAMHAPWQIDAHVLAAAGLRLGVDYPPPLVDLPTSRQLALAAYQRIKD
jgi:deoxyribodipyrimidine photo-lyase